MAAKGGNVVVLEFDDYGFAVVGEREAEESGGMDDERCHVYSPLRSAPSNATLDRWREVCADSSTADLQKDLKKLRRLLKAGGHNSMRSEIWKLFLGTSQTRSENQFDYNDRINDLCCKLKMYGITETSNQENMQIINSLLDRRTPDDIVTANEGVIEKKILEGEGGVEGGKGDGCEGERGGGGEGGRGGQGEGGEGGVEGGKSDGCERERGGRGEGGGGGGEGRVESGFGEELVRERERVGEEGRGGEGERGAKLLDEEDRGWLSISRQIMMDVIRTFPTHRFFRGETTAKESLFRVLMMYSEYNATVGYCQGMAYVAALLLMHMDNEEDVFWSIVMLFDSKKYLSGFYDSKLSRVQTYASVFSLLLRERQPQLAQHLESLCIHPLMYMTSWFMCLFTSLPCWDSVLAICDLIFLEGYQTLFRAGLAILQVCSAELQAMNHIEVALPFIQKLPSRLASLKVLMPVVWRTSVLKSDVEWYQDTVLRGSSEILSQPLKRSAPTGEVQTPAKRRKMMGDSMQSALVSQSFLSRLITALTPTTRQTPRPLHWSMSTSHNDVEETAAKTGGRQAGIVRREQKRRGRRALKTGIERDSHRDLKIVAPSSSVRSNRKRKRDDLENVSPFSKSRMVEMKEFCNLSTTHLGTQPFSPYLPVFLSPSLPPPFTVSPSPYSINDDGDIRETSASFLASSPVLQFRSPSSRDNSFGASLLRRSRRLAQRKGQGSASGCLSQAVSFISPDDRPLQDTLHTSVCTSAERVAFRCFTTPTPIRANQQTRFDGKV